MFCDCAPMGNSGIRQDGAPFVSVWRGAPKGIQVPALSSLLERRSWRACDIRLAIRAGFVENRIERELLPSVRPLETRICADETTQCFLCEK